MKKTLLLVLIAGTLFASSNRVDALGGNVAFWGDDYASMSMYPANVNNHNVAWTDGDNFTAVWGEGTKFGFGGTGTANDVVNMWFGTGDLGANFGVNWTEDAMNFDVSAGYNMKDIGNFGVHYNSDWMGFNMSRDFFFANPMWDSMALSFMNMSAVDAMDDSMNCGDDGTAACDDAVVAADAYMMFGMDLWSVNEWGGTTGLFATGFNYSAAGDGSFDLSWTFGAETKLNDWATLRVGYVQAYDLMNTVGEAGEASMGLGFNYGGLNLDMTIASMNFLNDPMSYFQGYNTTPLGSGFTVSYNW